MDSLIRWKKGDYIKLGQAVARFNRIINELEVEDRSYLPELKSYKNLKENIYSRKELNRVVKALRQATSENLEEIHTFSSGEEVSKWEFSQLKKAKRRGLRTLEKERETILSTRESIGMGDERLSEIKAIEESFETLEEKTRASFKKLKERINYLGRSDYNLNRAMIFRQNFYTALEGVSHFQNYEVLKKKLDSIENPIKFYEYVKQSPILMDLFLWYKNPDNLFYGAFSNNQEAFNSALLFHLQLNPEDVGV